MSNFLTCHHRLARLYYDAPLCRWAGRCPDCSDLVVVTDEQIARGEAHPKAEDVAADMLGLGRDVEPYR